MPLSAKDLQFIDRKLVQKRIVPLGILLGIGVVLVLPSYFGAAASTRQLKQIRDSMAAAYKNVQQLPKLEEEKNRFEKKIKETRQSLFTEDEIGAFVADLSELARSFNVQVTSSRPNRLTDYIDPAFKKSYEAFEFAIDLECEFHGLGKLLASLYQKPKIFKIEELKIIGRENNLALDQVSLSVVVISAKGTAKNAKTA